MDLEALTKEAEVQSKAYSKVALYVAARIFHKDMFDWRAVAVLSCLLNLFLAKLAGVL